jgi:hypothetical protein
VCINKHACVHAHTHNENDKANGIKCYQVTPMMWVCSFMLWGFLVVLGIELRALSLLGKCSTT